AATKGLCDPSAVIQHGLLRAARVMGEVLQAKVMNIGYAPWPDGWVAQRKEVQGPRQGGATTRGALRLVRQLGDDARDDATDPEALLRAAPIGLIMGPRHAFELALESSRKTHPRPEAGCPAASFAQVVALAMEGKRLQRMWGRIEGRMRREKDGASTLAALE